jgi:arginine-tRNA-protein transferase
MNEYKLSMPFTCEFTGEKAEMMVVENATPLLQKKLTEIGFERNGENMVRPSCHSCHQCLPARINVSKFSPNRSQRRLLKNNVDISLSTTGLFLDEETTDLLNEYLSIRHAYQHTVDTMSFLSASWSDTFLFRFYLDEKLVGVACVDRFGGGFNLSRSFYSPHMKKRGMGIFMVLKVIDHAAKEDVDYIYIGNYINGNTKMAYKNHFKGVETYLFNKKEWNYDNEKL